MKWSFHFCVSFLVFALNSEWNAEIVNAGTFEIDYESNSFLKDGVPFRYISGTIHYFRVHPTDWRDRLRKLRYAGCNAVETYIEWSSHEPESGVYDFQGGLDLVSFVGIAQEEDLLVILRPGPFIDAERDMGGLPYWLLRENPSMKLRSADTDFLFYVDRWFSLVFPLLVGSLYENGGPVIMVQVENEYGSYPSCDFAYTAHLRDLTTELLGNQTLQFTTDGSATSYLKCGKVANVYATIDFGISNNVASLFDVQRLFEPSGPLVNSEFYPGWLDHWGDPHATRSSQDVASTLDDILAMNASVNIYVFHGGTSFGFGAGSNLGSRFQACPTSYDYDAPLNEAGDPTEKYFAIRNVTEKYDTLPNGTVPPASPKFAYGMVNLSFVGDVFQIKELMPSVIDQIPLTFEALSVSNGIVMYTTTITDLLPDPTRLTMDEVHDRGYVFVDEDFVGIVTRELYLYELPIQVKQSQNLTIIVESQGRLCYGSQINDFKGIIGDVMLGSITLQSWRMTALPFTNTSELLAALGDISTSSMLSSKGMMSYYNGTLDIPTESSHPMDTFLKLDGWTKGYAWVNNFLLGRYWPTVGPQVTLYVPHGILKTGHNSILILELENAPCDQDQSCSVTFTDTAEIDGPTPQW